MASETEGPESFIDFHLSRFTQISESHCGPAVIQMLLSNLGVDISQEAVAEAGGATDLIELNGMRVDQLARAVALLAPHMQFWYKEDASLDDLVDLVKQRRCPVGVEWQGLFEDEDEDDEGEGEDDDDEDEDDSETGDDDYGHYSIVSHVDPEKRELIIADPYKDFISQERIFTFDEFEARWYDYNEVQDPKTGRAKLVEDYHMLFIITPRGATFPAELGMRSDQPA